MPKIRDYDKTFQIGLQPSSGADRTSAAAAVLDFAPPADGVSLGAPTEVEGLDTDHGVAGEKYSDLVARNGTEQPCRTFVYPTTAGTFFDAVFKRVSGELQYYNVLEWFKDALPSEDKGRDYRGCLFSSVNLSVQRTNKNAQFEFDAQVFVNAKRRILTGAASPTLDHCKVMPFGTASALVDFVDGLAATAYGPDRVDVRSVQVSWQNGLSVDGVADNLTDMPLHRTWTEPVVGNPGADVTLVARISQDEFLRLDEFTDVPTAKLRIALVHPKAAFVTSTSTVTAGNTGAQVLNVAATAGFLAGDVVVITHPTAGFVLARISSIVTNTSITINGTTASDPRVTLNGGAGGPLTIKNLGLGWVFDRMDFVGMSPLRREGAFQVVELRYRVKTIAGATFPIEYFAYNHLNSRL